jgi:hypothetical protein
MNVSVLFNSFTAGELSPLLAARVDAPSYASGAKRLENAIPMLSGGLRKRPGTWYVDRTNEGLPSFFIDWLLADGTGLLVEVSARGANILFKIRGEDDAVIAGLSYGWGPASGGTDLSRVRYAVAKGAVKPQSGSTDKTPLDWILFSSGQMNNMIFLGKYSAGYQVKEFALTGTSAQAAKAVAFYGGRLCLGGSMASTGSPTRIMLSRVPDSATGKYRYDDFTAGTAAGDAIIIDENDMAGSGIQWIAGGRRLVAATERTTWQDAGEIPAPATFDMNIIEYIGSSELPPKAYKGLMIYAGRSGKSLRALVWRDTSGGSGYADVDLSASAAHLFDSGILDYAVMDYPIPTIWVINGRGELVSCSIQLDAGIAAFARHPLWDGEEGNPFWAFAERLEVARRPRGDVLYVSVRRAETDGDGVVHERRNIERLELEDLTTFDYTESHYVDSGLRVEFAEPTRDITGLTRFIGQKVNVFADGSLFPPVLVKADGSLRLGEKVTKAHVGLGVKTLVELNTGQIPANGTSFGKKRRVEKVTLNLYKTIGGKSGITEKAAESVITQRFGKYEWGAPVVPYTGNVELAASGTIDTEGTVFIIHGECTPFTALAAVERIAVLEA